MPNPATALQTLSPIVEQRTVVDGYVSTVQPAPKAFSDKLYVIVPEHSTTVPLGPCDWGAIHGTTLPVQGAACVVVFDEREVPVVVWWEGVQGEDKDAEFVSALPSSPFNGQEIYYQQKGVAAESDMEKQGITWHLRYRAGSASTYKWEFVGGSAITQEIAAEQAATWETYKDLATVGPSVTAPLAGDYDVDMRCRAVNNGGELAVFSLKIGAEAPGTFIAAAGGVGTAYNSLSRAAFITGITVSAVLKMQYRGTSAAECKFMERTMAVLPLRVG